MNKGHEEIHGARDILYFDLDGSYTQIHSAIYLRLISFSLYCMYYIS